METRDRSAAEWVTFAVSALVLGVVVVVLLTDLAGTSTPALPVAVVDDAAITHDGDWYRVPVTVRNRGDGTAINTQVTVEFESPAGTRTADQTIDFLGADESTDLVFLFDEDPARGRLTARVTGYTEP